MMMVAEKVVVSGRKIGWCIGRLFVYTRPNLRPSLRSGGCMVNHDGRRKLARHVWWRICWVFE